jgi:hypothetical protein
MGEKAMARRFAMTCATVVVAIIFFSTMTFAAEIVGTVSAVDEKGMATIKTTDGKELHAQMTGVKAGDKVDCHPKGGKMSCHKLSPKHK